MYSKEFEKIDSSERAVVNRYISEFPVKIGQLARELGVKIKISSLRAGISGQIKKEDESYVIRVNRHEARERQRFTICHELAHFLLHRHIIDSSPDGITDNVLYRSGAPERIEYEANRLAADILMPMKAVQGVLDKEFKGMVTEATIENLAAEFQVSKAAMEIRLSKLVDA